MVIKEEDLSNGINKRKLREEEEHKSPGVHEEKIFTKNILNILIDLFTIFIFYERLFLDNFEI